jgi:RNA polymerase sigma-70 factor (ECF subfamily)
VKIARWILESVGGSVVAEDVAWPMGRRAAAACLEPAADAEAETARLFDELRSPVLRYLLSMGLSPADGEDVIQEVFVALFQHLRQGRPRTNLRGWVFRTTHNLGLRSRQRRRAVNATVAEDLADARPNPEQALASRQRLARIQAVVRALPEREQWCLSLRAEGLSYREIAQAIGVSLGAVSIAVTRAVARLREADR